LSAKKNPRSIFEEILGMRLKAMKKGIRMMRLHIGNLLFPKLQTYTVVLSVAYRLPNVLVGLK
jgi:hypothetical protein